MISVKMLQCNQINQVVFNRFRRDLTDLVSKRDANEKARRFPAGL